MSDAWMDFASRPTATATAFMAVPRATRRRKVLAHELAARTDALASAADDDISLGPDGAHPLGGKRGRAGSNAATIRLSRGSSDPADEHLPLPDRERVQRRLEDWLSALLRQRLGTLLGLKEASDLTGLARGLAFRLAENHSARSGGDGVAAELSSLDQTARAKLRKYGVRFGAFNIYVPALLKPAAADLLLSLWALHSGRKCAAPTRVRSRHVRSKGSPRSPADNQLPEAYWHAAGFQRFGTSAVRIDMLERLADMIRERIAWRVPKEPAGIADEAKGIPPAPEAPPSGATGDGGFRVSPELMSVVGCSGDEFASILRAFGFRSERKNVQAAAGGNEPPFSAGPVEGAADDQAASSVAADETRAFDLVEIWRPRRRKIEQHASPTSTKPRPKFKARKPAEPRRADMPLQASKRASPERAKGLTQGLAPSRCLPICSAISSYAIRRSAESLHARAAAGQMALVRAAGEDANGRGKAHRGGQGPHQWHAHGEAEPAAARRAMSSRRPPAASSSSASRPKRRGADRRARPGRCITI